MWTPEKLIAVIEREKTTTSVEGLMKVRDRNEFEFGRLSGFVQGLDKALEFIKKSLDDEGEPGMASGLSGGTDDDDAHDTSSVFGKPLIVSGEDED